MFQYFMSLLLGMLHQLRNFYRIVSYIGTSRTELSNVKRTDIWTAVRTVLEKNPGLRAKFLIRELREKTGLNRSNIYVHLSSFVDRGEIHRESGCYWLAKPCAVDEKSLERIRRELDKIKEDYVHGHIRQASERTHLLWGMLPTDWYKEVESLLRASRKRDEEMGLKPHFDPSKLPIDRVEILEILRKLSRLLESCE